MNKTNRRTEFQFYWYDNSTCFCIKCTNANVQLRTPDDGQKGCPKHVRAVIPIKLEFSASVGLIHKEFVRMDGHTILKYIVNMSLCYLNGCHWLYFPQIFYYIFLP